MSGSLIGALRVTLGIDTAAFEEGLGIAQKRLNQTGKSIQQIGDRMVGIGKTMSIAVTAPIAAMAAKSIGAFRTQEKAVAAVEAALGSMGDKAGFTSQQLQSMASDLQENSLFGDEEILSKVTANLLTFGNVADEQFTRAQQVALDLSARLGQDLQSSTVMLGKALNDPITGLTAMTRVGITFSEQQKEQIKTMAAAGDVAGAQALMLAELEKQYGGQAKAAAEADGGITQLSNAWGDFQEQIGGVLVEVITPLIEYLRDLVSWLQSLDEDTRKWIVGIGLTAAALGPLLTVVGLMTSGIGKLIPVIGGLGKVLLFIAANPAILAFAAVVAGIYLAWKNWDKIEEIVRSLYNGVKKWLQDKLGAIFDWVKNKIAAVTGFFKDMYEAVVGNSYVPDMVDGIAEQMRRLDEVLVQPVEKATSKAKQAFLDLAEETRGLLDSLFPDRAELNRAMADLELLDRARAAGLVDKNTYTEARDRIDRDMFEARRAIYGDDEASIAALALMETADAMKDFSFVAKELPTILTEAQLELKRFGEDLGDNIMGTIAGVLTRPGDAWDILKRGLQRLLDNVIVSALQNVEKSVFGDDGLGGFLGGVLSGLFGGRASGGPVLANQPYIVGEKRPELFVPSTAGRIEPKLDDGGQRMVNDGTPQSLQFNFYGPVTNPQEVRRSAAQAGAAVARMVAGGQRGI